ncbi:MAG: hypothetical protein D6718_13295 [Acidobacteria bacterium]|nr:MAG: hypothetical protein D6718_13295 [Acidobacteriota bacterium]
MPALPPRAIRARHPASSGRSASYRLAGRAATRPGGAARRAAIIGIRGEPEGAMTWSWRSVRLAASLALLAAAASCGAPAGREPSPAGAIEIPNARHPLPGVLTGGQPTAEQLRRAAEAGYRTVVNLRTEGEAGSLPDEPDLVRRLGLRYVAIPVDHAAGLTEDNVRALHEILEDPEARPMIVHCASGNRVGALFALHARMFEGLPPEEALAAGRQAGLTRLEPEVRRRLESIQPVKP